MIISTKTQLTNHEILYFYDLDVCVLYIVIYMSNTYTWLIRKGTRVEERNSFLLQFVSVTCNAYKYTQYVRRVFYLAISFKRELSL